MLRGEAKGEGTTYDEHELPGLLEKDLAQGIAVETVTAD
jgi:hypothetical protein